MRDNWVGQTWNHISYWSDNVHNKKGDRSVQFTVRNFCECLPIEVSQHFWSKQFHEKECTQWASETPCYVTASTTREREREENHYYQEMLFNNCK